MFKDDQDVLNNIHKYKTIKLKSGQIGTIKGVTTIYFKPKQPTYYITIEWLLGIAHNNLNTVPNSNSVIYQGRKNNIDTITPKQLRHHIKQGNVELF